MNTLLVYKIKISNKWPQTSLIIAKKELKYLKSRTWIMTHDSSSTRICGAIQIVIIYLFVLKMNCFFFSCFNMVCCCLDWCAKKEPSPRTVWVGKSVDSNFQQFPPNVIRNQKYSIFSFIPVVRPFKLFELRLYLGVVHKLRWKE